MQNVSLDAPLLGVRRAYITAATNSTLNNTYVSATAVNVTGSTLQPDCRVVLPLRVRNLGTAAHLAPMGDARYHGCVSRAYESAAAACSLTPRFLPLSGAHRSSSRDWLYMAMSDDTQCRELTSQLSDSAVTVCSQMNVHRVILLPTEEFAQYTVQLTRS